jgi:hypothetical protein
MPASALPWFWQTWNLLASLVFSENKEPAKVETNSAFVYICQINCETLGSAKILEALIMMCKFLLEKENQEGAQTTLLQTKKGKNYKKI